MAETLPAYQYFKFKEDLGHPEALLNEYYQLYFTPNIPCVSLDHLICGRLISVQRSVKCDQSIVIPCVIPVNYKLITRTGAGAIHAHCTAIHKVAANSCPGYV